MRTLNVVLAAALLVTGIVAVHLWRELRLERTLNATLHAQSGAAPARLQPASVTSREVRISANADGTGGPTSEDIGKVAAPVPALPMPVNPQHSMRIEAELLRNPEFRSARLAQIRASLPQQYPGAADDLGLNPQEAAQLYDLLAEQQFERNAVSQALLDGRPVDAAQSQQRRQAQLEVDRRFEQQLGTLLGAPRQAQWKDYQARRGAYQEATQVATMLEQAGQAPLTADQTRAMRAAYVAARQSRAAVQVGLPAAVDRAGRMEQQLKLQDERNVGIIEAAERNLSAAQAEAVRTALAQQAKAAKAQIQLMQLRAQAQRDMAGEHQ